MADESAADRREGREEPVIQEATEELHLPGPSYLPVIVAVGITLAIVGVVLSYFIVAAGLIITVVAIVKWVGETREDVAELPLEH